MNKSNVLISVMFTLIAFSSHGKCLFNEKVELGEKLKNQIEEILNTNEVIGFIAEVPVAEEIPVSLLPDPLDYDFSKPGEGAKFRFDRRSAHIKYLQSIYSPYLFDFREIKDLQVPGPDKWTLNVFPLKGNIEAICRVSHIEGIQKLNEDFEIGL